MTSWNHPFEDFPDYIDWQNYEKCLECLSVISLETLKKTNHERFMKIGWSTLLSLFYLFYS